MDICAGCHQLIDDQLFLMVGGRSWHEGCTQCSVCHCPLNDNCFLEEGELYCRDDYCRCFGEKCPGCGIGLREGETVRKNGSKFFHLHCFSCAICKRRLETGEDYQQADHDNDLIFCRSHSASRCNASHRSGNKDTIEDEEKEQENVIVREDTDEDDKVTENYGNDDKDDDGKSSTLDDEVPKKKKRVPRTFINPEQMEVLAAAFLLDRKPTKPKKEQLSQITGLSMRVIQVWFQNRRQKEGKRGRHEPTAFPAQHALTHDNYFNNNFKVDTNIGRHGVNYFYYPTFG